MLSNKNIKVMGLITARGGSKGVPRKNVSQVAGKPLIAWTIDAAKSAKTIDRLIVSTDDEQIARISREWGAEVPFTRPADLARDDSPHVDCVIHALEQMRDHAGYEPDYLVLLQPTSPLRTSADIDAAVNLALQQDVDAVVSVCETHDHPFLVRRMDAGGVLSPFMPCDLDYARRQDLPAAFAMNGAIYVNRVSRLLASRKIECDNPLGYVMPPERSLQIDTPWDMRLCELVLEDAVTDGECDQLEEAEPHISEK